MTRIISTKLMRVVGLLMFLLPATALAQLLDSTTGDQQIIENESSVEHEHEDDYEHDHEHSLDDAGEIDFVIPFACHRASSSQMAEIDKGNKKFDRFQKGCWKATGNSRWCEQLTRPNPSSRSTFLCTYGSDRPHRLIHPNEGTWGYAFKAVKLVQDLERRGVKVAQIYNWWRPEPYNDNVGGAPGRHPSGTSVDVRFASMNDMTKAHKQLCAWRKQGRLRALGYYGSTGLHLGVGDSSANTWGKGCP